MSENDNYKINSSVVERFFKLIDMGPTRLGCWLWTGFRYKGHRNPYGMFHIEGKLRRVHRVSYKIANGDIPDGFVIDHLCRNAICVNPTHLEAVTSRENTLRGIGASATNKRKILCKRGHDNWRRREDGTRQCITCKKNTSAVRYQEAIVEAGRLGISTSRFRNRARSAEGEAKP